MLAKMRLFNASSRKSCGNKTQFSELALSSSSPKTKSIDLDEIKKWALSP